jgi:hypothetical protein
VRSGSVEGRPLLVSFDRKALATLSLARVRQVVTIGRRKGAEAEESVECRDCLRCKDSNGFAGRAGRRAAQTDRAIAEFKRGPEAKGLKGVPCLHRFGASMPTVRRQAHPVSDPSPQSSVGGPANSWPGRAATGSHTFRPKPQNTAQNPAPLTPKGKHGQPCVNENTPEQERLGVLTPGWQRRLSLLQTSLRASQRGFSGRVCQTGVSAEVTSRSGWNHDLVRSRFRIHRQSRPRSYSRTRFRSHTQRRGRRRNPRGDRGRSLRRRPGPRCRTRD